MKNQEIRKKFIEYFEGKDHKKRSSSSLIPSQKDGTVLLTTAGVQQFVPYFMGVEKPDHARYVSIQKCFRTTDLEEVGDESHLSFFEMFGNFSIGDYGKEETIKFAWEFLTEVLQIPKDRLWVTIFGGDKELGLDKDVEAEKVWLEVGVPADKIVDYGRVDNFWGPPGEEGPAGPASEIHYDRGEEYNNDPDAKPNDDQGRFLEIWNLVFTEYYVDKNGKVSPLEMMNIDTGMGLERLALVMQGKDNIFETDLFAALITELEGLIVDTKKVSQESLRIIADHIRGAVFLVSDGVIPSKEERGYILRRMIRRAVRHIDRLDLPENTLMRLARKTIQEYKEHYPDLSDGEEDIVSVLEQEQQKFRKSLARGLKLYRETIEPLGSGTKIPAKEVFKLYDTYGFPFELTRELAAEDGMTVSEAEFMKLYEKHQEVSRKGVRDKFARKGGGQGDEVKKAHTATHLMYRALKDVLGDDVKQAGSQLSEDEFRFDFTYGEKLTDEEKQKIEDIVNEKINAKLPVRMEEYSKEDVDKMGVVGLFEEKYGDQVKVYFIGDDGKEYSKELCGGPHVENTSEIGSFKILKEKSSSAGVRRIKAVVGDKA
ncbi:alanine--tRNA ligase [Patescibacteria group bacterium]